MQFMFIISLVPRPGKMATRSIISVALREKKKAWGQGQFTILFKATLHITVLSPSYYLTICLTVYQLTFPQPAEKGKDRMSAYLQLKDTQTCCWNSSTALMRAIVWCRSSSRSFSFAGNTSCIPNIGSLHTQTAAGLLLLTLYCCRSRRSCANNLSSRRAKLSLCEK